MTVPISQESQELSPSAFVSLFQFDSSILGGPVLCFSSTKEENGNSIKFGGVEYPPLNFTAEGFAWDSASIPRPKVTASIAGNGELSASFLDMVIAFNGAQGARLTRIRTLVRYLDGHEDGGQAICYPPDIYLIDRVLSLTKSAVQWELIAPMDLPNCKLPSRQALRETCGWIYRRWDSAKGDFIYGTGSLACPYAAEACFNKAGVTAPREQDECGHRLKDCVLRHGEGHPLPFGGFVGLARTRV